MNTQDNWNDFKENIGKLNYQGLINVDDLVRLVGKFEDDYISESSNQMKEFKDDIDTIGKCANCGVEFHIHKEQTKQVSAGVWVKASEGLPEENKLIPFKDDEGAYSLYKIIDGEICDEENNLVVGFCSGENLTFKPIDFSKLLWLDETPSTPISNEAIENM